MQVEELLCQLLCNIYYCYAAFGKKLLYQKPKLFEICPADYNNILQCFIILTWYRVFAEQSCDIRSSDRTICSDDLKAPFVTPEECQAAGCCYDDMFMSEPSVKFYRSEGRIWCFVPSGGKRIFVRLLTYSQGRFLKRFEHYA